MAKYLLVAIGTAFSLLLALVFLVGTGCACMTKEMAYVAAMKSDLRNMVTAEEAAFATDSSYRTRLEPRDFVPSTGVSVIMVDVARGGWSARVGHDQVKATCAVFVGPAPPDTLYQWRGEGEPVCRDVTPRPSSRWQRLTRMFR